MWAGCLRGGAVAIDEPQGKAGRAPLNGLEGAIYHVGRVSWDHDLDFSVPLTNRLEDLRARPGDVDSQGVTNLRLGLETALRLLDASSRRHAQRVVVFLTDGMASKPESNIDDTLLDRAKSRGVTVHTIGLDVPEVARAVLEKTAATTGASISQPRMRRVYRLSSRPFCSK